MGEERDESRRDEGLEAQAMPGSETYGEGGGASTSRRRGTRAAAAAGERGGSGRGARQQPGARSAATTPGTRAGAARGTATRGAKAPDLRADLRNFITEQGGEWGHDEWTVLLGRLGERGHDVSNPDVIGDTLEGERIAMALGAIPGVGPRRVASLVDRFGNLWALRQASLDDLASVPGIPRALAERISAALH